IFHTDADLAKPSALRTLAASWARARTLLSAPMHIVDVASPQLACSEALPRACGQGWVAVGDAAAAFDPLSSGGHYFAKATADLGAECILSDDLASYAEAVASLVTDYLQSRDKVYAQENRFIQYPFWSRRSKKVHPEAVTHDQGEHDEPRRHKDLPHLS